MEGQPATKFVILSSQRSGSTWVVDLLNRLPGTTGYGELLLHEKRTWDVGALDVPRYAESSYFQQRRPSSLFAYLDALYERPGAVGFKLMYSQLRTYPEVLIYLLRHQILVVHLIRWNHLDVVISGALKRQRGVSHRLVGEQAVGAVEDSAQLLPTSKEDEGGRVYLDPSRLVQRLGQLRRHIRAVQVLLRCLPLPHLEISYETLREDQRHFEEIWRFLGVNHEGKMPKTDMVRIRRGEYRDVIVNCDEVERALLRSKFAQLIA